MSKTMSNNKPQMFWVLQDGEGELRPVAFVAPNTQMGEYMKEDYIKKNKLENGETIVLVEMIIHPHV